MTQYFVDLNAVDDTGTGLAGSPKKHIASGIALMSPSGGDAVTIADGTYSDPLDALTTFVNGAALSYNTIQAANMGGVVVTAPFSIINTSYIKLDGLKIENNLDKGVSNSNHIKVTRTGFKGGQLTGNNYTFVIGGSNGEVTNYNLFEDCWFYGAGGRQNILMYHADYNIFRRCVIRHDHGWSNIGKTDPEGLCTTYNSSNNEIQNCILLDSVSNAGNVGSEWAGAWSVVHNADVGSANTNNNFTGCVALNVEGNGFPLDGADTITNITMKDMLVMYRKGDVNAGGAAFSVSGPSLKANAVSNATVYNFGAGYGMFSEPAGSTLDIDHSIVAQSWYGSYGVGGGGVITDTYMNCFNNALGACGATGLVATDPELNGMLYPVRAEQGTALRTSGNAGVRQGARIMKRVGTDGTLHGDVGYNVMSAIDLWPFPNEDIIKSDFAAESARGFATGNSLDGTPQTLTKYIWESLGNQIPDSVYDSGQTRLYMMPMVTSVIGGTTLRHAKYALNQNYGTSAKDYGSEDVCVCTCINIKQVEHEALIANADVVDLPLNKDGTLSPASVTALTNFLESYNIPANWLNTARLNRRTVRIIMGMFEFNHQWRGLTSNSSPFKEGVNLTTRFNQLTTPRKQRVRACFDIMGIDRTTLTATSTLRDILILFGQSFSGRQIRFGGDDI